MGITLRVNGNEFTGFEQVTVTASIDEVARSFSFSTFQDLSSDIVGQDECTVFIEGQKVLTGYIERIDTSVTGGRTSLTFSGRSKTADFIDCSPSVKGFNFSKRNIAEIADRIAEPFGIDVISNAPSATIAYSAVNQGETCFEYLERLCRQDGLLLTTNANGDLVITQASTDKYEGSLNINDDTCGIVSSSSSFDWSNRFSSYEVKAQSDDKTSSSTAKDTSIRRHRPTIIIAEGNVSSPANRARNHALRLSGEAITAEFTVKGFLTNKGELLEPNKLIYVNNPYLRMDQSMLVKSVMYEVTAQGFGATVTLIDPRAYYAARPRIINSFEDLKDLPSAEQIN